jgi:hypothetical protein
LAVAWLERASAGRRKVSSIECELRGGLLRVTLRRTPEPDTFAHALQNFGRQHPGQDLKEVPVLIDGRLPDLQTVSYAEVQKRAQNAAALKSILSTRWALVVSTPALFGQGRQYQAVLAGSGIELQVFRDEGTALAWLGLEGQP